jgi:hypothetical protein
VAYEKQWWLIREQWWLMRSSGGSWVAVVAHWGALVVYREQWWLMESSSGSLVATPDCENCSPGFESSNLPSLQWTASP